MKRGTNFICLIAVCLSIQGCDASKWPGFGGATTIPNARIQIELLEPGTIFELYPRYLDAAARGGYLHTRGMFGHRSVEELVSPSFGGSMASLLMVEAPNNNNAYQRGIAFLSKFNAREESDPSKMVASSITFMYRRDNLGSFTKEEWLQFYTFYEEILPEVFPDADIQIIEIRHPAVFTDDEVLRQILEETDIEIPEQYLPEHVEVLQN